MQGESQFDDLDHFGAVDQWQQQEGEGENEEDEDEMSVADLVRLRRKRDKLSALGITSSVISPSFSASSPSSPALRDRTAAAAAAADLDTISGMDDEPTQLQVTISHPLRLYRV